MHSEYIITYGDLDASGFHLFYNPFQIGQPMGIINIHLSHKVANSQKSILFIVSIYPAILGKRKMWREIQNILL